ncbi:MAG: VOC family protein [Sneathiella sp.]
MLKLDHLTIIAPSLDEGINHVHTCLGIEPGNEAVHTNMGTHNRRLRLGDDLYLEIVAIDPDAPAPGRPRWLALDFQKQLQKDWEARKRLKSWVARTEDIGQAISGYESLLGAKTWLENAFHFSVLPDGSLPLDGALPCVIDRGGNPPPSTRFEDQGFRLQDFVLDHPEPTKIIRHFNTLKISGHPTVRESPDFRLSALIKTPDGIKTLT